MKRVEKILQHHKYQDCLQKIRELEAERIFCGHDMVHLLDVARLAYIFNLEEQLRIEKEQIYAAALLHDIGRHRQYLAGIPHQEAGLLIADEILAESGFGKAERFTILEAIHSHRNITVKEKKNLAGLIYRADKMSRSCATCVVKQQCNRSEQKKNQAVEY